jgi:hypothetical protein
MEENMEEMMEENKILGNKLGDKSKILGDKLGNKSEKL